MNTQTQLEKLLRSEITVNGGGAQVADILLRTPMKLPFAEITARPSGIAMVRVHVEDREADGFGEGATLPQPLFTDDWGESIAHAGQHIIDAISGTSMSIGEMGQAIQSVRFEDDRRFPTARMMVEMAILDGVAKAQNTSVGSLLGVPKQMQEVPFGKSIGGGTVLEIQAEALHAIESGAMKIKIKITPRTARDVIQVILRLREEFDSIEIMVDANGTFDPDEINDLDLLREVDGLGLVMIEEPVSRMGKKHGIDAMRELRRGTKFKTPICLDDCLIDEEITKIALSEGLADIVNIKPGRIGSIIKSIELADICKKMGKQIMVGGMLEATPGRSMTTVLAALFHGMGFTIPGDLSLPQERLEGDLVSQEHQLSIGPGGGIVIPSGIGWGFGDINLFSKL